MKFTNDLTTYGYYFGSDNKINKLDVATSGKETDFLTRSTEIDAPFILKIETLVDDDGIFIKRGIVLADETIIAEELIILAGMIAAWCERDIDIIVENVDDINKPHIIRYTKEGLFINGELRNPNYKTNLIELKTYFSDDIRAS